MDIFLGGSACGIVTVVDEIAGWAKASLRPRQERKQQVVGEALFN